jgi:hypothetical protein
MSMKELKIGKAGSEYFIKKGYRIPINSGEWYCVCSVSDKETIVIGEPKKDKTQIKEILSKYSECQIEKHRNEIEELSKKFNNIKSSLETSNNRQTIITICTITLAVPALFKIFRGVVNSSKYINNFYIDSLSSVKAVEIINWGLFKCSGEVTIIDEPSSPYGVYTRYENINHVLTTDKIRNEEGMDFGIEYQIVGFPQDAFTKVLEKRFYPGVLHYKTQKKTYFDQTWRTCKISHNHFMIYCPGDNSPLGQYKFQVFVKGKLLATKEIVLTP